MPHRIVIIDDRPNRPFLHLPEDTIKRIKSLPNVNFATSIKDVDYDQYDVIAIHRSYAIRANLDNELDNQIKNKKYLILFSGGVSQPTISNKGHKATLGSEVFYSSHLLPFCEDISSSEEDIQLFKLLYGVDTWKLPILLRLRQLYWLDPNEEDIDIDDEKENLEDTLRIYSIEVLESEITKLVKAI